MTTLSEAIASAVAAQVGVHVHDVCTYDAWDLWGCSGCDWRPLSDGNAWADFRAHLSTAIAAAVAAVVEAERAEDRARLAAVEALLPDECWVFRDNVISCLDITGLVDGPEWTDDMRCLPCRVRAALAPTADPEPTP